MWHIMSVIHLYLFHVKNDITITLQHMYDATSIWIRVCATGQWNFERQQQVWSGALETRLISHSFHCTLHAFRSQSSVCNSNDQEIFSFFILSNCIICARWERSWDIDWVDWQLTLVKETTRCAKEKKKKTVERTSREVWKGCWHSLERKTTREKEIVYLRNESRRKSAKSFYDRLCVFLIMKCDGKQ